MPTGTAVPNPISANDKSQFFPIDIEWKELRFKLTTNRPERLSRGLEASNRQSGEHEILPSDLFLSCAEYYPLDTSEADGAEHISQGCKVEIITQPDRSEYPAKCCQL